MICFNEMVDFGLTIVEEVLSGEFERLASGLGRQWVLYERGGSMKGEMPRAYSKKWHTVSK